MPTVEPTLDASSSSKTRKSSPMKARTISPILPELSSSRTPAPSPPRTPSKVQRSQSETQPSRPTIYNSNVEPEGDLVPSFGQCIDDYFAAHGMLDEDIRAIYLAYCMAVDYPQFRTQLMDMGMAESIALFIFDYCSLPPRYVTYRSGYTLRTPL
ncbi:hypothetical protein PHLCEN_2v1888 [Hermanssonia centrifuga]|uniref:Uncharacterized protein n=1 Tax=Hermanssonia centrifuga TaxID=98765 RepID=A0A2R6RVM0_9APHY|nr:hypothetical protein PHLCEN_2v1888 [Hermanssonia centrifuga]